jgi:hypothetical protein
MQDYFLTAPNRQAMLAVLEAIWLTNNPPLPDDTEPPQFSEQGWVVHGFDWWTEPPVFSPAANTATDGLKKPGYHALLRVHGGELGPVSIGMLAAAGIEVVSAATEPNPPVVWQ